MTVKAVLFDLDGTLLPMDQDVFVKAYFSKLAQTLAPLGYEPRKLIDAVWGGTYAMLKNDGSKTNEEVFWDYFATIFGEGSRRDEPHFAAFYETEFQSVQSVCGFAPEAGEAIAILKEAGIITVLATNPIFPAIATQSRIRWAGLRPEDFVLYTTYENIGFSKPNPAYYKEIVRRLGVAPEECLMVGNDVGDDMVAQTLGMQVFLLTDCLINKDGTDLSQYPHGDFPALLDLLRKLS